MMLGAIGGLVIEAVIGSRGFGLQNEEKLEPCKNTKTSAVYN